MQLHLGDCLNIMPLIPDGSVDLVLVDPPYGTTACKWDSVIPLDPMWENIERVIKPNGAIVITASQPFTTTLIGSNMKMFRYSLVWQKTTPTGHLNAKKMFMRSHEDITVFYKSLPTYNPQKTTGHKRKTTSRKAVTGSVYGAESKGTSYDSTERYPLSVIKTSTDTQKSKYHPSQKPVALMEYLIKTYTNKGESVLDFTMGSGTTGVACQNTGRQFIGIEKDNAYFLIAEKRLSENQLNIME